MFILNMKCEKVQQVFFKNYTFPLYTLSLILSNKLLFLWYRVRFYKLLYVSLQRTFLLQVNKRINIFLELKKNTDFINLLEKCLIHTCYYN